METMELKAQVRQGSGKGPSRRLRAAGMVPAIFYSAGSETRSLAVNTRELIKLLREREESLFIKIRIEGEKGKKEHLSMIKEIQMSPTGEMIYHVDFYEIRMDQKITVDIPVHLVGMPAGVVDGGELHQIKRELKISGLPASLPEFVQLDVTQLKISDSLKVADVPAMEGIEILDAPEIAIAAVSATRVTVTAEEEAAEEAAPAEPELVGKKAEEEKEKEKEKKA
jgi:large subunit ribosomal protein L25